MGLGMGGRQLFTGRMGVNVGAELVVHVQNGCEGREIFEKFACLIPYLPERNLPMFQKKYVPGPNNLRVRSTLKSAVITL